ncbi:MAG: 30S ribosome-binding factor RbfA [Cellvibrionaceae bacterium]
MPKDFSRSVRVADQIQKSLAQLIQTEISDPRIGLVNINEVNVSPDYANAKVFVTFIQSDDANQAEESIALLNKASGFLRSKLAKTLNSRTTPRLRFEFDKTSVSGQKLTRLIDQAVLKDQSNNLDGND